MKLDGKQLLDAFKIVDRVPVLNAIASSLFVKLHCSKGKLTLSMKSLACAEAWMSVEQQGNWTFYSDRRLLSAFLTANANAKSPIEIVPGDKELVLRCGRRRVVLQEVEPVLGYERWKRTGQEVQFSAEQQKALVVGAKFAPQTLAADNLSCVQLIKGYGVIASDSYVIFGYLDSTIKVTLPFPLLLPEIMNSGAVLASTEGSAVDFGHGYFHQPVSERCATDFPKTFRPRLDEAIKRKPLFHVKAKALRSVLERFSAFVFSGADDTVLSCQVTKGSDMLTLSLRTAQGTAHDKVRVTAAVITDMTMNWKYLALKTWLDYAEAAGVDAVVASATEQVLNFCGNTKAGKITVLVHALIGD